MKKFFTSVVLFIIFSCKLLLAGDTIKVMHYNLLYYDKIIYSCDETNNNVNDKNIYLNTIIEHYQPDIFTVNEMNGSVSSVDLLLNNALNVNGEYRYQRATYTGNFLINMLYFNTDKLVLKHQSHILTSPRQTDVYTLYAKTDNLIYGDTVFLTCIVTHLKAGKGTEEANDRALASQQIMNYIKNRNLQGNIMLLGDLNLYNSDEQAFQNFLTETQNGVQLLDPVDAIGWWSNNSYFADYHTQSTHIYGDCHSGGGMDDRFDFILTSTHLLDGTRGAKYVENSYWAMGQDGNRFNGTISSPTNYTLPSSVISALYNMSDHLPVTLKINVDYNLYTNTYHNDLYEPSVKVINPIGNTIEFWLDGV
ncbi:MAG TPA: endonuclease/exonuclease/phosphatase family protein, partial [Bacteroidetes bacterium]|nr:endonuclease/exonuclease/phosphatase family protein [Bacteroidota bacterium]